MRNIRTRPNRSRGFTLLELMFVLAALGFLGANELNKHIREQRKIDAQLMAEHIYDFQRKSLTYYRGEGGWPADAATLVAGGYIDTAGDYYGTPYSVSIDAANNELTVNFDTKETDFPFMLTTHLPNVVISGTSIATTISAPSEEISNEPLYPRDGSRPLTGTMDADGNSISNAIQIGAERFYSPSNPAYDIQPAGTSNLNHLTLNSLQIVGNATVGGSCTTKTIGTTSVGKFVACESGVWKTPGNELPVGSIYTSTTTTNPSVTLGYGRWVAFGAGRVPVGQNTSDANFNSMEEIGGAKTHTLTENEMPSHNHSISYHSQSQIQLIGGTVATGRWVSGSRSINSGTKGGSQPHNNLQPYIVVKMWKRTS